jgi:hypothetical protein
VSLLFQHCSGGGHGEGTSRWAWATKDESLNALSGIAQDISAVHGAKKKSSRYVDAMDVVMWLVHEVNEAWDEKGGFFCTVAALCISRKTSVDDYGAMYLGLFA